ncbi:uncharacterized protein LOC134668287 [Cydia fagiglandana]|uniref:uncharacterized protein LOC134668287 n=1 Tax=Cydia fagiglandana TaxID=1458189 RepID=UPI002FEE44A2
MQNLVCCLIFFLTFRGIKGDFLNNGKQENIASGPGSFWDENNFGESVITELDESEDDEDFDDYRLRKSSAENIKLYKEFSEAQRKVNKSNEMALRGKSRARRDDSVEVLECLQCNGSISDNTSIADENCYSGNNVSTVECGMEYGTRNLQECFIELHPLYIKRGCHDPFKLNVTFYCKCTLCNDKPGEKREYFVYEDMKDWAFDNRRLQQPNLPGVIPACKYCNTTGAGYYQTCLDGTSVEYTICDEGQMCYTHIDKTKGSISRGCANKPAYNSLFTFCNQSYCNDNNYWNTDAAFQFTKPRNRTHLILELSDFLIGSNTGRKVNEILFVVPLINLYVNTL